MLCCRSSSLLALKSERERDIERKTEADRHDSSASSATATAVGVATIVKEGSAQRQWESISEQQKEK